MTTERRKIARCECSNCSTICDIKLNKNGCAYYFCPSCNHNEKWGKRVTITRFLNQIEQQQSQEDNAEKNRANSREQDSKQADRRESRDKSSRDEERRDDVADAFGL